MTRLSDIVPADCSVEGDLQRVVSTIEHDSSRVGPNSLFIAVKGEKADGHDFIDAALKKGAAAIVFDRHRGDLAAMMAAHPGTTWIGTDSTRAALACLSHRFYGKPSEELTVIGITGTNGKTTTSYLLKSVLEQWGRQVGLIGTIRYLIGDKAFDAPHTTPEAPDFQRLLRDMASAGCSHVVSEISSHALVQRRVDGTRFRVAVFTNLTRDHLDFHETMEDYFAAKKRLFTDLLSEDGIAVVNQDDSYGKALINHLRCRMCPPDRAKAAGRVITYSLRDSDADLLALKIATSFSKTTFVLRVAAPLGGAAETQESVSSRLIGAMNVYNILAAAGVCLALGVPVEVIARAIGNAPVVTGRFEAVSLGQDFLAVVDYAHTDDALHHVITTACELRDFSVRKPEVRLKAAASQQVLISVGASRGKVITVFGCGGNRDRGKRPKMGSVATRLSDFVIITSDNPRREEPRAIIRDIEQGATGDNYMVIPERDVAIRMAVELASAGDVVLIAGKGHEDYQEIQGKRYPFSDRQVLEDAIRRTLERSLSRRRLSKKDNGLGRSPELFL